jgi:cell wall-associated NlpC family hydrolase
MKIIILILLTLTLNASNLKTIITFTTHNHTSKSKKSPVQEAKKYLGTRYRFGASTKTTKRFDCSSFVKYVFKKSKHKNLPRTTSKQIKIGKHINKRNAKKGDLIFFGDSKRRVGHVGIIIDPKKKIMIHASSAKGKVVISSYNTKYYKRKYRGIRRI